MVNTITAIPDKYKVDEKRPFYGKYWPEGVPHQLDYDYNLTLGEMMDQAGVKYAADPAIWFLHGWTTYGQLSDAVNRMATAMANMGIKKGDVVAIHLPNCPQYVIAYYAITKIGAIVTGVNPTYKPMEILHQFKITNAKYLVVLDALYQHFVKPIINEYSLQKVIYTNLVDWGTGLSGLKKLLGKKLKKIPTGIVDHPNAISFLTCLKTAPNPPKVKIEPEKDAATLITTGGTTGVPKAAELTHLNTVANCMQCKEILLNQRKKGDSQVLGHKTGMVGVLPLYHSFAMTTVMNISIAVGAWVMMFPKPPPTEELLETLCTLPDYNGFIYCAAEILFQRIAELPDDVLAKFDLKGRLKLCVSGAGPLHDYVREPFERKTGARITEGYGLSEASPVVSVNAFYAANRETGYIGVPAPGTDWMIFEASDFSKGPLPIGQDNIGEICCSGPQVMHSYWKEPEQSADHLIEYNGRIWLLTGDLGFMDEFGRVQIKDRKKQLIKMAGHSIFPAEVESLMGNHPAVLECAVAGLPDEKLGEAVKAWVALRPESVGKITSEELLTWAKENMTQWKAPKFVEIVNELPKSLVGKVLRRVLQEADPIYIAKQGKK